MPAKLTPPPLERAKCFIVGNYQFRYGQGTDQWDQPTNDHHVWLWNGYYWSLFVRHCASFESGRATVEALLLQADGSATEAERLYVNTTPKPTGPMTGQRT